MDLLMEHPSQAQYYRNVFNTYPQVDEHEFATAFVNYVERTGRTPGVWAAIVNFVKTGEIA